MYKEKRFTEEEIRQASGINIVALASSRGYDVKKCHRGPIKFLVMVACISEQMVRNGTGFPTAKVVAPFNFLWN